MRHTEHGMALGLVIVTSVVFSVAAFGALAMALSSAQRSGLSEQRLRARYAAEAGLAWAMQSLWQDPTACFSADPDLSLDTDGAGPLPPIGVDITATPCPASSTTLKAKVVY